MDFFQWWQNQWNPIAKPTADLAAEALRKYQAGEIDFATYQEATGTAEKLTGGIIDAKADYAEYTRENSLNPANVLQPVTDLTKNLIALLLVGTAIYIFVLKGKRIEI